MIRTARVIDEGGKNGGVALYDKVTVYLPEDGETEELQIVTTMRKDPLHGLISLESPVGKALLGRRAGDRVLVKVNPELSYYLVIRSMEKGEDDAGLAISKY